MWVEVDFLEEEEDEELGELGSERSEIWDGSISSESGKSPSEKKEIVWLSLTTKSLIESEGRKRSKYLSQFYNSESLAPESTDF